MVDSETKSLQGRDLQVNNLCFYNESRDYAYIFMFLTRTRKPNQEVG